MKIIVFANQKGGTGKTTTVINVGDAFVRMGKRVLIADLDPQGHAAVSLNLDTEPCVANWLMHPIFNTNPITPEIMNQWIRATRRENLFVLPGNQMTAKAQRLLTIEEKPINYIKDLLPAIRRMDFDYLLFDTPPSTGGLQEMASWAADLAVIVSISLQMVFRDFWTCSGPCTQKSNGVENLPASCPLFMTSKSARPRANDEPANSFSRSSLHANSSRYVVAGSLCRRTNDLRKRHEESFCC